MSCSHKLKALTTLLLLLLSLGAAKAQTLNGSPYSNYGLGDLNSFGFSGPASAGYTSTALTSNRDFTFTNPASLGHIDFTVIKLGAILKNVSQESGNQQGSYTEADLSYLALGLPMMNRQVTIRKYLDSNNNQVFVKKNITWGLGFGLTPFTNTAYGNSFTTDSSFGSFENIFNGEGGISRVFINNGFRIGENLSIGHSTRFLFGSLNDYRVFIFPDSVNIKGQQDHRRIALNGFQQTLGAMYQFKTRDSAKKNTFTHTFGASYTISSNINSNTQRTVQSMDYSSGNLVFEDTLLFTQANNSKIKLPSGFNLGYSLQRNNKWRVSLEYKRENWSEFSWATTTDSFSNSDEYSIGLTLNPDAADESFKKIEVRMGLRHKKSYLNFQELNGNFTNLSETGITFGLGIPLIGKYYGTQKSLKNMLDIGLEYYTRGQKESGLVKENYFNISFGITFNDYWFKRRKIY